VNGLIKYLGDNLSSIAGVERPGIVHRLDKDTSGLIMIAKTNIAHQHLSNQLKTKSLKRIYHAICWGVPSPVVGKIETYIKRHKLHRLKMDVDKYDGKLAITNYRLLNNFDNKISLVECSLQTGRTHQIRVHMTHIGTPLLGDQLYGSSHKTKYINLPKKLSDFCKKFNRQALIAKKIGFIHPVKDEYMEFEIDYDNEIKNLLEIWDNCDN
jgi:23S rRNA pseudouridine1911/1915/1917 synthase